MPSTTDEPPAPPTKGWMRDLRTSIPGMDIGVVVVTVQGKAAACLYLHCEKICRRYGEMNSYAV